MGARILQSLLTVYLVAGRGTTAIFLSFVVLPVVDSILLSRVAIWVFGLSVISHPPDR